MIVGYIKGFYILRYDVNSILGYMYEITDGVHIFKTLFSNDETAPLKMVETLANSNGETIKNILTA